MLEEITTTKASIRFRTNPKVVVEITNPKEVVVVVVVNNKDQLLNNNFSCSSNSSNGFSNSWNNFIG